MATATRANTKSSSPSVKASRAQAPQTARALWLCGNCLRSSLVGCRPIHGSAYCGHCGVQGQCENAVTCPHPACGAEFQFEGHERCPSCTNNLADAVPLRPLLRKAHLLDLVFPKRRETLRIKRSAAEVEFRALLESWKVESLGCDPPPADHGSRLAQHQKLVLSRHQKLLETYRDDVDRFLAGAPIRLAKFEGDYSWEFEAKRDTEINRLLEGILAGKHVQHGSLHFLARCHDSFPEIYSRQYLNAELKREFDEVRSRPRPAFQLNLDYARHLTGQEFEHWVARLLRDHGVPNVVQTPASRDQGADLIVMIETRKVVIQLKQYSDAVGNDAVQEAHAAKGYYNATEAWVVTTSLFTKDAADLASRLGVRLIPGTQLLNLPRLLVAETAGSNQLTENEPTPQVPPSLQTETSTAPPDSLFPSEATPLPTFEADQEAPMEANATAGTRTSLFERHHKRWFISLVIASCVIVAGIIAHGTLMHAHSVRDEQSIQLLLSRYRAAIRTKNLDLVEGYYAPIVETYYRWHDVPRETVLKEIRRAFAMYQSVAKLDLRNITFRDLSEDRATATFDKEWDFRGPKQFAGAERQEMIFVKIRDEWRIASEKELKVYWVHHGR
jgi:hypothetical protein